MDVRTRIISSAEDLFDRQGFAATGMDEIAGAARVSSRTLYKHMGGKTGLICAVLSERDRRFRQCLEVETVEALFLGLKDWMQAEGARGCLFLRAAGETIGQDKDVHALIRAQKTHVQYRIGEIISRQTGDEADDDLAAQILVLVEGATAAAMYRGAQAIDTALSAATKLLRDRGVR